MSSAKIKKSAKVCVYSDGGARGNPGPAAIGILVVSENGEVLREHKECLGEATNNTAEYRGILGALKLAHEVGAREVTAYMDSEVVMRQLTGAYRVREEHLRKLYESVKKEEKNFAKVIYNHVRREHPMIKHVDRLVNRALDEVC
ncbi:MAG: ribonuclease HI family protein [Candidatus Omnitrophica bacterium]|nr:ribonuclease HI family protein [Candidatus Omnitrophota bacterium]